MATPAQSGKTLVTLIPGDGIGPEVTYATQRILDAAGARIEWEERKAGAEIFKQGLPTGVPEETIESIKKTRVVLKGPLETPVGYGEKSANVTLRKLFETYGNIRPVRELPGVVTPYSGRGIDLVVVRENVEDLYAGIEHMQTPEVAQCLKIMSRKGCEKVVRLAFEVARAEGRQSVACATKANIMKLTEGMMKRVFEEIAPEYPDIESWHVIIDNCAHQLVKQPEQFDVIVTSNMNGDIISDLTSALVGGLGFAPGANIGQDVSIFEAVHGSAPKYAGKDVINPTAVLGSGIMMLRHLGDLETAALVENALLLTLEQGKLTKDAVVAGQAPIGTTAFTDAVIANLGETPKHTKVRAHKPLAMPRFAEGAAASGALAAATPAHSAANGHAEGELRRTIGVDVFVESTLTPDDLGGSLVKLTGETRLKLKMISNRGTKVFPATGTQPDTVDHWRCRFVLKTNGHGPELGDQEVLDLVGRIAGKHRWMHLEKLQEFAGAAGYTKAQGED